MIGQSLVDAFGKDLRKSFGSMPGSTGKGAGVFAGVAKAAGIDSSGPYTGESYDAAASYDSPVYGPELSIPAAFATPAKTPAPFPVDPGIEPKDFLKSFPNASTND